MLLNRYDTASFAYLQETPGRILPCMSCWPAQPERGQGAFHNILPEAVWGGNLPRNLPALRGLMATQRKKNGKYGMIRL